VLREIVNVRQLPGECSRRWFEDDCIDLIVWLDESGRIAGFQLCYDKFRNEHALMWRCRSGFSHLRVDDGEQCSNRYKGTPVLRPNGAVNSSRIRDMFRQRNAAMDRHIADFVTAKLDLLDDTGG